MLESVVLCQHIRQDTTYFVPVESENWLKIKLGSADDNVQVKKEKLKDWVRRPRNIRHANWVDLDHEKAIEYIDKVPLGNVLFRPSRRLHAHSILHSSHV